MKQRANELPSPLKGRGLLGIDGPPEKKQPFNERAKQTTSALSFGQYVTVRSAGKDRHGCTLGDGRTRGRKKCAHPPCRCVTESQADSWER